jgi:hypothetical protein
MLQSLLTQLLLSSKPEICCTPTASRINCGWLLVILIVPLTAYFCCLKCVTYLQAFSIFCGLGIHNTLMYGEVEKAMARQKVAIEVGAANLLTVTHLVEELYSSHGCLSFMRDLVLWQINSLFVCNVMLVSDSL